MMLAGKSQREQERVFFMIQARYWWVTSKHFRKWFDLLPRAARKRWQGVWHRKRVIGEAYPGVGVLEAEWRERRDARWAKRSWQLAFEFGGDEFSEPRVRIIGR